MKKLFILFVFSIFYSPMFAQANNSHYNLASRIIDIEQKEEAFGLTEAQFKNKKGSPYANEKFMQGNIYQGENLMKRDALMRYNIFSDEIEIKNLESDTNYGALIKDPNTFVKIFNELYVYIPFEGLNEKGHYFNIVSEGKHFNLCKKTTVSYSAPSAAKTSYDRDRPATFTQKSIYYLVSKKGDFYELPTKKSKIIAVMAQKKTEIKNFIKSKKIDLKKEADLTRLVAYYNSLL